MPDYEYKCPRCGRVKTLSRKMAQRNDPVECLHGDAGGDPALMKKAVSQASFLLKGGGWYKDGYSTPKPS